MRELKESGFAEQVSSEERLPKVVCILTKYHFEQLGDLHGFSHVDFGEQFESQDFNYLTRSEIDFLVKEGERAAAKPSLSYTSHLREERRNEVAQEKVLSVLGHKRTSAFNATGLGPKEATKRLCAAFQNGLDRKSWLSTARQAAIVGRAPKSLKSIRTGLRAWMKFAHEVLGRRGRELPPTTDELLQWSGIFQHQDTFKNYCAHVKMACELEGLSTEAFANPLVRGARVAVKKRKQFTPGPKMAIRLPLLAKLVQDAIKSQRNKEAVLYLVSYAFLLRVPSEALPMIKDCSGASHGQQSVISCKKDHVELRLMTRKNKIDGSIMQRSCWCSRCKVTCPVHRLGAALAKVPDGTHLFKGVTEKAVLSVLRSRLHKLGVQDAPSYNTKAFRRGHGRQMADEGASLCTILAAGEWSSKAFMVYQDYTSLERDAVLEAHMNESDDNSSGESSKESSSDDDSD